MRYLLCTIEYPPQIGGVASYYGNLVEAWGGDDQIEVFDRRQMLGKGPLPWIKSIFSIVKAVRRNKYRLVMIGQVLPLGTAAIVARLMSHFRFAVFLHGMDLPFALKSSRKRFLTKIILDKSSFIICANSRVREILIAFNPELEKKTVLVHPGASVGIPDKKIKEEFSKKYDLEGKKVMFSLGRLVKRKGFDEAIRAFIKADASDAVYLLAGDGPERSSLEELVQKNGASDRIFFVGQVSEQEKWSLMDLCDIFITVSREIEGDFEGFGIVYLEANLLGKPVIAGSSGGVADAVIDGETGFLVNPDDSTEIASAISRLLNSSDESSMLGHKGKSRAQIEFSWKGQAQKMKSAIEKYL